ncbi:hypothetical protein [Streptomyces sp. NPDC057496]|uniref:hypothetical protein n=1 Tax=Streptomyces sp. NPDC057496 TaxID=3346149 RepID=UPI0036B49F6A
MILFSTGCRRWPSGGRPEELHASPATRRLLGACLDLITDPLLEEVQNRDPADLT